MDCRRHAHRLFDRNGATVALDTTGMELLAGATQKTYALTIDHNGGNCD
jgi:hypothetical protein